MSAPFLVSACLAGVPCRYDGGAKPDPAIVRAVAEGRALPACAEVAGGLPTPRPPAEIRGGDGADVLRGTARVVTEQGADVTAGVADEAVARGVRAAVLQPRSPSCGCGRVYDGSFSGGLVDGDGVLAAALRARGIGVTPHVRSGRGDSGGAEAPA